MKLFEDNVSQIADNITAMMNLESGVYRCDDYLEVLSCLSDGHKKSSNLEHHRQRICAWMYQLLDSCNINREIVYYSMNFLDRFMSKIISGQEFTVEHFISGSQYELASLTVLYMAMKLNGCQSQPVRISRFVVLSRRKFSANDICKMEMKILSTLSWQVHPPCPAEYVEKFVSLLLASSIKSHIHDFHHTLESIQDIAMFLSELSVCDYYFVTENPSITAFAAVFIALENFKNLVKDVVRDDFLTFLEKNFGLNQDLYSFTICRQRLQELYAQNSPQFTPCEDTNPAARHEVSSPVSVSQFW